MFERGKCPDNYVGSVLISDEEIIKNKSTLFFEKSARIQYTKHLIAPPNTNNKNIVVILESPHKDEFANQEIVAPALGTSGRNLQDYFICSLQNFLINNRHVLKNGIYNIVLMNAIQYQCSLGRCPKIYRDLFWLSIWCLKSGRVDFIDRLKQYRPSVIINLCTKGSHKSDPNIPNGCKSSINRCYLTKRIGLNEESVKYLDLKMTLQKFVNGAIQDSDLKDSNIIIGCHPSSWVRKEYRALYLVK